MKKTELRKEITKILLDFTYFLDEPSHGFDSVETTKRLETLFSSLLTQFADEVRGMKRSWGDNGYTWEDQTVCDELYYEQLKVLGFNNALDEVLKKLEEWK